MGLFFFDCSAVQWYCESASLFQLVIHTQRNEGQQRHQRDFRFFSPATRLAQVPADSPAIPVVSLRYGARKMQRIAPVKLFSTRSGHLKWSSTLGAHSWNPTAPLSAWFTEGMPECDLDPAERSSHPELLGGSVEIALAPHETVVIRAVTANTG